jgi:hypothetical protein
MKEDILFLDIVYFLIFGGEQRRCDGRGGGAQRPVSVGYKLKRRVRAAHGGARAAKTHQYKYNDDDIFLPCLVNSLVYICT